MSIRRASSHAAKALVACMVASVALPGCIPGGGEKANEGNGRAEETPRDTGSEGTKASEKGGFVDDGHGTGKADAGGAAPSVDESLRKSADADENLSYAEDKETVFSNNKVLLFARDGSPSDAIVESLRKYGKVDATNASAGMYVVEVDGHRGADELARLIDEIVAKEPLIEAGSINWVLPSQPSAEQEPSSGGMAPEAAPEKVG